MFIWDGVDVRRFEGIGEEERNGRTMVLCF